MTKLQVLNVRTSSEGPIYELSNGREVGYWQAVDMVDRGELSAEHVNDGNPDQKGSGEPHRIVDMDHLPEPEVSRGRLSWHSSQ